MAKLKEEILVIKVSKLLRDSEKEVAILTAEHLANLEAIIQELAGDGVVVEVAAE